MMRTHRAHAECTACRMAGWAQHPTRRFNLPPRSSPLNDLVATRAVRWFDWGAEEGHIASVVLTVQPSAKFP
jgi:hypothetical protein